MRCWGVVAIVAFAGCRQADREHVTKYGEDVVSVPEHHQLSTLPEMAVTPISIELGSGKLAGPETVIQDIEQDVYFVSNINGNANATDDNGYISKVSPSGELLEQYFIDGRQPDVTLHAPRGMVIGGDTLFVADEGAIRLFDRITGEPKGSWDVAGSQFLNDLAIDANGRVLATDTGIEILPTGPVKTGAYTIYAFDADGHSSVLAQGDDLQGPNGIIAGPSGIFVVEFMGDEHGVYSLDDQGKKHLLGTLPFGELDGLAMVPDGSLLVSSWLANGVYRFVPGQPPTLVVEHLVTPAGISYDALRGRVLIPELAAQRIRIEEWAPPMAKLTPMSRHWGAR